MYVVSTVHDLSANIYIQGYLRILGYETQNLQKKDGIHLPIYFMFKIEVFL